MGPSEEGTRRIDPIAGRLGLIVFGAFLGALLGSGIWHASGAFIASFPGINGLQGAQLMDWILRPVFFVPEGPLFVNHHDHLPAQSFTAVKPDTDLRVFLLGESQAMGTPYVYGAGAAMPLDGSNAPLTRGGIATWLEVYLQMVEPGRRVQVVNAALANQDLKTAAAMYAEIAEIGAPDLVVILAGNGESYNVRYGSPEEFDEAVSDLAANVRRLMVGIAEIANRHRIRTYVVTVPTNLRNWFPNFSSYRPLHEQLREGRYAEALETRRAHGERDDAMDSFLLARGLEAEGKYDEAYHQYLRAKDLDLTLIRAHSVWNDVYRGVGNDYVLPLDLEHRIRQYATHGIPGFDLFHDHCHYTVAGNVFAAREIARFYQATTGRHDPPLPILDPYTELMPVLRWVYEGEAGRWMRLATMEVTGISELNPERVAQHYTQVLADLESRTVGR